MILKNCVIMIKTDSTFKYRIIPISYNEFLEKILLVLEEEENALEFYKKHKSEEDYESRRGDTMCVLDNLEDVFNMGLEENSVHALGNFGNPVVYNVSSFMKKQIDELQKSRSSIYV